MYRPLATSATVTDYSTALDNAAPGFAGAWATALDAISASVDAVTLLRGASNPLTGVRWFCYGCLADCTDSWQQATLTLLLTMRRTSAHSQTLHCSRNKHPVTYDDLTTVNGFIASITGTQIPAVVSSISATTSLYTAAKPDIDWLIAQLAAINATVMELTPDMLVRGAYW